MTGTVPRSGDSVGHRVRPGSGREEARTGVLAGSTYALTPVQQRVADTTINAWSSFARTGTPATSTSDWPAWRGTTAPVHIITADPDRPTVADPAEEHRRDVLGRVAEAGVPNLVVITGDWHSAFVDDIRPDFDDPVSPVIGTEFTARSVTSSVYVHELTPRRWTTTMRVIGDRRDPASPVTDLTSFTVQRGRAGSTESPAGRRSPAQYRRSG